MADRFVLTAQVQLQAPTNVRSVVSQMQRQLKGVSVPLNVTGAGKAAREIKKTAQNLKTVQNSAKGAATGMNKLELALGGALRQVIRYDIARAVLNMFTRTIRDGVKDAVAFEREMIKISQVTKRTMASLKDLEKTITTLSVGLGTSSSSLIKTSRVLAQTGMSAKEVKISLEALAKTTLAPTFDDITNTTETAIAAMRQFKIEARGLESVLGSINAVAGQFAVEAADIGVAIRRAGGAFKSAGGELNELIALFTSVRSTTRETAETIATGFRTIFTRMQRPTTIRFLKQFGIELQDLSGKFVGPYEAVRRLNLALSGLDPRDVRYSQIVEQLGGFRQVSKVIPMIQQFGVAQQALNVAQQGGNSLSVDAAKAQEALAVKLKKVTEEFKELFREITQSTAFKVMAEAVMALASALAQLGKAIAPVLPLIMALGAAKGAQLLAGRFLGRGMRGFNRGGIVPGTGNTDSVPAMLTPGEFVIRKSSVKAIGANNLAGMNRYSNGGAVDGGGWGNKRASSVRGRKLAGRIVRKAIDLEKPAGKTLTKTSQFNDEDKLSVRSHTNYDVYFSDPDGDNRYTATARPRKGKGRSRIGQPVMLPKRPHLLGGTQFETALKQAKLMTEGTGNTGGNERFAGRPGGGAWVEVRSKGERTGPSEMLGKAYGQALKPSSRIQNSATTEDKDTHKLHMDTLLYENRSKIEKKLARKKMATLGVAGVAAKATGKNKGCGISGSDTVPALLTPGEFVFNKKSAQSIGYGNLRTMNNAGVTGFAKGGVVGVKRFSTGGGSGAGRGGLTGMFDKLKGSGEKLGDSMGGLMTKFFIAQMVVDMAGNSIKEMAGVTDENNQKVGGMIDALGAAAIALYTLSAAANSAAIASFFSGIGKVASGTVIGSKLGIGAGSALGLKAGAQGAGVVTRKSMNIGFMKSGGGARGYLAGIRAQRTGRSMQEMATLGKNLGVKSGAKINLGKVASLSDDAIAKMAEGSKPLVKGFGDLTGKGKELTRMRDLAKANTTAIKAAKESGKSAAKFGKNMVEGGKAMSKLSKAAMATSLAFTAAAIGAEMWFESDKKAALRSVELAGSDASAESQRGKIQRSGAAAGAASGAGWGALIGSFILPGIGTAIGAALGGVAGGITGWWNATDEAEKAINANKFGRAMDAFSDALEEAATGPRNPRIQAAAISAGMDALMTRMNQAMEPGQISEWNAHIEKAIPKMNQYITRIASGITTFKDGEDAFKQLQDIVGKDTIQQFANLSKIGFDAFKEQMIQLTEAQKKAREAAERMSQALAAAASLQMTALNLADAFKVIEGRLKTFDTALNNLRSQFGDTARVGGTNSFGSVFKNINAEAKFDTQEFQGFIGTMSKTLQPAVNKGASDLTKTFKQSAKISGELPSLLVANKNKIQQAVQSGDDAGSIITRALENALGGQKLDPEIKKQLEARIGKMVGAAEGGKSFMDKLAEDPQGLSKNLMKFTEDISKAAEAMASVLDSGTKQIAAMHNERLAIEAKITNARSKLLDLEYGELQARKSFAGKDVTPAEAEKQFQKQQANIQGVRFGRQQGVAGLAGQLAHQQKQVAQSDAKMQNLLGMDPGDMAKTIKENANFRQALARTKQALEAYTNVQERTAALQTALNKERTAREKKLEAVQSFAFATDKDRVGQLKAFNATLTAVRGGLGAIPQEMRPAVQGVLKQFGEVKLPGFGGKTGNELAAEMAVDEMEKLTVAAGGQRFTPQQRKEMIEQSAGEAGLQAKILAAHKEAQQAQRALIAGMENDKKRLEDMLMRVNQIFLLELKQVMFESAKKEQDAKLATAKDERDALDTQLKAAQKVVGISGGRRGVQKAMTDDVEGLRAALPKVLESLKMEGSAAALKTIESDLRVSESYGVRTGFGDHGKGGAFASRMFGRGDMDTGWAKFKGWMDSVRTENIITSNFSGNLAAKEFDPVISGLTTNLESYLKDTGMGGSQASLIATEVMRAVRLGEVEQDGEKVEINDIEDIMTAMQVQLGNVLKKGEGGIIGFGESDAAIKEGRGASVEFGLGGLNAKQIEAMMQELAKVEAGKNLGNLPGLLQTAKNEVTSLEAGVKKLATAVNDANLAIQALKSGTKPQTGDKDVNQAGRDIIDAQPAPTPPTSALMPVDPNGVRRGGGAGIGAFTPQQQQQPFAGMKPGDIKKTPTEAEVAELREKVESTDMYGPAPKLTPEQQAKFDTFASPEGQEEFWKRLYKETPNLPVPEEHKKLGYAATGGLIYANNGMFIPKGTDTVPAMLTPGEFVIRRAAVQAVGVDTLRAINSMGGTKHLSRGGQAGYYHKGDQVGEGLSMGVLNLDAAINRFSSEVSRLGGIFKDGMAVNVGGTIDVNVNINGGEIIDAASEHLGESAAKQVKKGINKMLKKHFPKIARKNEIIGKQKPRGTGLFGGKN